MKSKKILTIIILLLAVMLFSVGMIVKEADERRQDISDFEKLEDLITEPESEEPVTDNENTTEPVSAQSLRNLTPLFEQNADCLGWIRKNICAEILRVNTVYREFRFWKAHPC